MYRKIAYSNERHERGLDRQAYRVEELIDHILERMIFGLLPKPVVPREAIADHEAAQNVVRAEYADNTEREECQGNAKSQERFMIDETTRFNSRLMRDETDRRNELVLLGEPQDLTRNIADHSAYDARKQDLI